MLMHTAVEKKIIQLKFPPDIWIQELQMIKTNAKGSVFIHEKVDL